MNAAPSSRFRTALGLLRPGPGLPGMLACLVLWIPLAAALLDVVFGGTRDLARRWAVAATIADVVYLLCFATTVALVRGYLRLRPRTRPFGAATYFAISALLMPLALPVGLFAGASVAHALGRSYTADLGSYRVGLGFGAIITSLFFLWRARSDARARVRDLENAHLRAQLAALTAEMNPHLLFNALNTIASLVHVDPDRAEETVLQLAEVYRGTLRATQGATHALSEELRLCEAYLRVEQARFGERLRVEIDAPGPLEGVTVPVLLLQPLVENAVKHGISPRARGGVVTLRVACEDEGVEVLVEDDGVGLGGSTKGNGRALANCVERLRLVYGDAAKLDVVPRSGGGTSARLSLPLATESA